MDIITYALCKKLAAAAVSGIKNLTIQGTNLIIETSDGNTMTMSFPTPTNGISIINVEVTEDNRILCTLSDNSTIDAGTITLKEVQDGKDGISVIDIKINEDNHLLCTLSDGNIIDAGKLPILIETKITDGLIQVATFNELPTEGKDNILYLTLDTKKIYYFNTSTKTYEAISNDIGIIDMEYATRVDIDNLFQEDDIR